MSSSIEKHGITTISTITDNYYDICLEVLTPYVNELRLFWPRHSPFSCHFYRTLYIAAMVWLWLRIEPISSTTTSECAKYISIVRDFVLKTKLKASVILYLDPFEKDSLYRNKTNNIFKKICTFFVISFI